MHCWPEHQVTNTHTLLACCECILANTHTHIHTHTLYAEWQYGVVHNKQQASLVLCMVLCTHPAIGLHPYLA